MSRLPVQLFDGREYWDDNAALAALLLAGVVQPIPPMRSWSLMLYVASEAFDPIPLEFEEIRTLYKAWRDDGDSGVITWCHSKTQSAERRA